MMKKLKTLLFNILILLVLFFIIEMVLRFFVPDIPFADRLKYNLQYEQSGLSIKWLKPNQIIYEKNDTTKIKYRINSAGFRGNEIPLEKDSNEIRIAILGGSHVFDMYSYDYNGDYGFPKLLEDELNKIFPAVRVINVGVPGSSNLEFLNKVLLELPRYQPDYIMFNSIWNDLIWINQFDDRQLVRSSPEPRRKNPFIKKTTLADELFGWSILYRKIRDGYYHIRYKVPRITKDTKRIHKEKRKQEVLQQTNENRLDAKNGLAQYQRNLKAFVKLVKLLEAKPILVVEERYAKKEMTAEEKSNIIYKLLKKDINHVELISLYNQCNTILYDMAEKENIPIVDIHNEMIGDTTYFADHVHTTPKGSKFIAKKYAKFFLNELLKNK